MLYAENTPDPKSLTRWNHRNPSAPELPPDDPAQPFCALHASTLARLTRDAFGPHPAPHPAPHAGARDRDGEEDATAGNSALPPGFRDWNLGLLQDVLGKRDWCRACAFLSAAADTASYSDRANVIGCWIWDGVCAGGEVGTMRLRIAPEMVGWDSAFEPFDLVPLGLGDHGHVDGQFSLGAFCGRPVKADRFDVELVKSWIRACDSWHGTDCVDWQPWETASRGAPFIRLISLAEDRVVECPAPPPYVALSYVWGPVKVSKALKGNIISLMSPGGLASGAFPKSVTDAMALARALGFGYIWVDSICIIQDSPSDKGRQIRLMADIYSRASLTIVPASGDDANAGIPGLEPGTRELQQHTLQVSDHLTLVALHPDSHDSVARSTWSTRGWTYQERLLSPRCLFSLQDGSISFQCAKAVWGEDYEAEYPHLVQCAPMREISLNREWMEPGNAPGGEQRGLSTVRIERTPYLQEYSRLVEQYSGRRMTNYSDRLLGIDGVFDILRREFGLRFIQGLPETIFHLALIWQPREKLKRVGMGEKTGIPLFPSWSWGGWMGQVGYEDWDQFNGLPELGGERARRVIPVSSVAMEIYEVMARPKPGSEEVEIIHIEHHGLRYSDTTNDENVPSGCARMETPSGGSVYIFDNIRDRYHSVPAKSVPRSLPSSAVLSRPITAALHLSSKVAKFRITALIRGGDFNSKQKDSAVEKKGRFGLAAPSPATSDQPWLGTVLLPFTYRAKLQRDHEFIVLSTSYGFDLLECEPNVAARNPPFGACNILMVRRIEGEELERYHTQFASATSFSSDFAPAEAFDGWWRDKTVVERIGIGRMLKSAWDVVDRCEDFLLV